MSFDKKTGVIFDLDGTLWDACVSIMKIWNQVLKDEFKSDRVLSIDEIHSVMGLKIDEIGYVLFPKRSAKECLAIMSACCDAENKYFEERGARGAVLFDGLEETLAALSARNPLFIVSNCQCGYIEAFLAAHSLEKYFSDFEMVGRTGRGKGENIVLLMKRNGLEKAVYIGDTEGDFAAAKFAEIPFVHAKYGFGSAKGAKHSINSICELPKLLESIL